MASETKVSLPPPIPKPSLWLVVSEYKERYAPGNCAGEPYWQHEGKLWVCGDLEDAKRRVAEKQKESEDAFLRCGTYYNKDEWMADKRVRIIPLAPGSALDLMDPVESSSDDDDHDDDVV